MPTTTIEKTCAIDGCTDPAVNGWGHRWCAIHDEEQEIEYDLTLDATSYGNTDTVHQLATSAAENALSSYGNGEWGYLLLNSARASLIGVGAALNALDTAGHLVPEGATVTQQWQAVTDAGDPVTEPMDGDTLLDWMKSRGLADGEHLVTIRTVVTPVPRDLVRPDLAPAAAPAEGGF